MKIGAMFVGHPPDKTMLMKGVDEGSITAKQLSQICYQEVDDIFAKGLSHLLH